MTTKQLSFMKYIWVWPGLLLLAACQGNTAVEEPPAVPTATDSSNAERSRTTELVADTSQYDDYEIVSVLPQDAIPAIFNPEFFSADEADSVYEPDELIMGVEFDGDARAYSVPYLSRHEIVNDEVGGIKIAVTW